MTAWAGASRASAGPSDQALKLPKPCKGGTSIAPSDSKIEVATSGPVWSDKVFDKVSDKGGPPKLQNVRIPVMVLCTTTRIPVPWTQAHSYHHAVAPRPLKK